METPERKTREFKVDHTVIIGHYEFTEYHEDINYYPYCLWQKVVTQATKFFNEQKDVHGPLDDNETVIVVSRSYKYSKFWGDQNGDLQIVVTQKTVRYETNHEYYIRVNRVKQEKQSKEEKKKAEKMKQYLKLKEELGL